MAEQLVLLLQVMLVNLVLSGDNSVVIALASKSLPERQRRKAIWFGAIGAVALRLVLTAAAGRLLSMPYVQGLGALFLLWIAVKLLTEDEGHANVKRASTFAQAIRTIVMADLIMSLDNVLAIAAASGGHPFIMALGIASSIPIIVWGSTLVVKLLHKYPFLVYVGAATLGYTAGDLFESDSMAQRYLLRDTPGWIVPVLTAVFVVASGLFITRAKKGKRNMADTGKLASGRD